MRCHSRAEWRHVAQQEFTLCSRHIRDERSLGWENCDVQALLSTETVRALVTANSNTMSGTRS